MSPQRLRDLTTLSASAPEARVAACRLLFRPMPPAPSISLGWLLLLLRRVSLALSAAAAQAT